MQKNIELGYYIKDIVTGIEGTVIGKTQWLTGCDTVHIEPKPSTDGRKQEGITLDINRVKYVSDGVRAEFFPETVVNELSKKEIVTVPPPGGPHDLIKHPNRL